MPTPSTMADWSLRDAELPGFGVRLTRNGAKSFFVQTRPPRQRSSKRLVLPQKHLRDARREAKKWLQAIAEGNDPRRSVIDKLDAQASDKARQKFTFQKLLDAYAMSDEAPKAVDLAGVAATARRVTQRKELEKTAASVGIKAATLRDRRYAAAWLANEPLAAVPVHMLDAEQVQATFGPMFAAAVSARKELEKHPDRKRKRGKGPYQDLATAHKLLRHSNAAWNMSSDLRDRESPFYRWRKGRAKLPRVKRREGVLEASTTKGRAWLRALVTLRTAPDFATSQLATYTLCLLLWGGRKTEVQLMQWRDFDFETDVLTLRGENTKNGLDLHLPLAPWARSIVEEHRTLLQKAKRRTSSNAWVWPSTTGDVPIVEIRPILEELHAQSELYLNAHDLRRTVATDILGDTKDMGTVGIALGHSESVTAGYIQRRVAILRPVFEAREARLRLDAGLDQPSESFPDFTEAQLMVLRTARAMMKEAGIDPKVAAKLGS